MEIYYQDSKPNPPFINFVTLCKFLASLCLSFLIYKMGITMELQNSASPPIVRIK